MLTFLTMIAMISNAPISDNEDAGESIHADMLSQAYQECSSKAAPRAIDAEQGDCTRAEIARADIELNRLWAQVLSAAEGRNSETGRALLEEQRAWIAYKSANCRHYYISSAGTMETQLFGPWCELITIEDRIKYLEGVLVEFSNSIDQ
ncbi:MAG: lysozyme inhibitor LprI family protein [Sphingopyxis sp.]